MASCCQYGLLAAFLGAFAVSGVHEVPLCFQTSCQAEGVDFLRRQLNLTPNQDVLRHHFPSDAVSLLQMQMGTSFAISQQEAAIMGELQQTEMRIQALLEARNGQQAQLGVFAGPQYLQAPPMWQQQQIAWQPQWQQAQSSLMQVPMPTFAETEKLKETDEQLQAEIQEVKQTQNRIQASEEKNAASQAELQAYRDYFAQLAKDVAPQVQTHTKANTLTPESNHIVNKTVPLFAHPVEDRAGKAPEANRRNLLQDAMSKVKTIAHQLEDHVQNVGHKVADKVQSVEQSVGQRVKNLESMVMPQQVSQTSQQQQVSQELRDLQRRLQQAQLSLQDLEKEQVDPQLFASTLTQPAAQGA